MKKLFILLFLFINIYAIEKPHALLDSISSYSIDIGNGKTNDVYIFVDPICPFSKKFIKKISQDKMLQLINSYHIFLYRLPKFESDKLISHIYQSDDMAKELISVMVNNKTVDLSALHVDVEKDKYIKNVALVAQNLHVKKRPYIILYEGGSGYCRVSEGSASCMEEFDFE